VKTVRVWFLLLLTVLLPIRGAVAAAMLCPVGSSGMQAELRMQGHPMGHAMVDHDMPHDHATAHSHAGDAPQHDGDAHHAGPGKCNACSAFCSLTPLLSANPTLLEPLDLSAVECCSHAGPPPSFVSDGEERPPRTH
jgi:hypothetical protein